MCDAQSYFFMCATRQLQFIATSYRLDSSLKVSFGLQDILADCLVFANESVVHLRHFNLHFLASLSPKLRKASLSFIYSTIKDSHEKYLPQASLAGARCLLKVVDWRERTMVLDILDITLKKQR